MTKLRFICPVFGPICEEADVIMRINRATVTTMGHEWLSPGFPAAPSPIDATIQKDILVLDLACQPEYANAVFLDWDMEIRGFWEMLPGQPYFIYEWGTPRIGMVAVNGCTEWFIELRRQLQDVQRVHGFTNKRLGDKKTGIIPEGCYIHHRFTSGK